MQAAIYLIGNTVTTTESQRFFDAKWGDNVCVVHIFNSFLAAKNFFINNEIEDDALVIDTAFGFEEVGFESIEPNVHLSIYEYLKPNNLLVLNAVKLSIGECMHTFKKQFACTLIGANLLSSCIDSALWEITSPNFNLHNPERLLAWQQEVLQRLQQQYKIDAKFVADRVGLVTPRIICMIINEAFWTVQEGTATIEDIDKALPLGVNYPAGPFTLCKNIGIDKVYNTLKAVQAATGNNRYAPCALLRQAAFAPHVIL